MSTEVNNIHLDAEVFTALQEAAAREHKTVDEMARKVLVAGLQSERLSRVQSMLSKGQKYGAESGIKEEQVADIIHAIRLERDR